MSAPIDRYHWYWLYTRHQFVKRSEVRTDVPPPGWYVQLVCRLLLGWKLVDLSL